jgi:hypothetical protein
MPGKMARSDPRPSVRVARGVGSGQHLASVLQEGRKNANIDAGLGFIWRISDIRALHPPVHPRATRKSKRSTTAKFRAPQTVFAGGGGLVCRDVAVEGEMALYSTRASGC